MSGFKWNKEKSSVAISLANGETQQEVAREFGVADRTIRRWMAEPEFSAEVDRLTLMLGIASKAERLRIAKRVVAQKTLDTIMVTDKDLLDWLKFAQSETDGIKLDIAKLAAVVGDDAPLAD
jgi:transposase-like protein